MDRDLCTIAQNLAARLSIHFFLFIDNSIFKIGTAVIYFRVKPRYEKLSICKKKLSILKIIKDENETHFELQFDSAEHIDPSI